MDNEKIQQEILEAKKLVDGEQILDINNFPYLKKKLDLFFEKNPNLVKNNLFQHFLNNKDHLNVFVLSLTGDKKYKKLLEKVFREYIFEY